MSTPTTFTRLEAMPRCDFATPDCFCTNHFAGRELTVPRRLAQSAIARVSNQDTIVTTRVQSCPRNRITTIGKGATQTVWHVDSIFS